MAVCERGRVMAYKDIILDDSILDIDSWLSKEQIDEIVEVIEKLLFTNLD
jgi:predicted phage gp36 major capsid-like protein